MASNPKIGSQFLGSAISENSLYYIHATFHKRFYVPMNISKSKPILTLLYLGLVDVYAFLLYAILNGKNVLL